MYRYGTDMVQTELKICTLLITVTVVNTRATWPTFQTKV